MASSTVRNLRLLVIVTPALVLMATGLLAPLGGSHAFRQAHVAANIELFALEGLSLRTATYNEDRSFAPAFDVPLYQWLVASLCGWLPVAPLLMARLVSLALFVLAVVTLDRLLSQARVRRRARTAALVFFVYAPLVLFYFQAPLVDCLALVLALVSLQQYAKVTAGPATTRGRALMLLAAFLSTLVKSPVYLPVLIGILWHGARRRGVRAFVHGDALAVLVASGLGLVGFKLFWMVVAGDSLPLTGWERQHYFGVWTERVDPAAWRPVIADLLSFTSSPWAVVLAVVGAIYWIRRAGQPAAALFTGLLLGSAITLLVFLHLYRPHNYYQLPLAFPLACFAGQGLAAVAGLVRRRARRAWPAARVAMALLLIATAVRGGIGFEGLARSSASLEVIQRRGEWIREHSRADDYVIYLAPRSSEVDPWNPLFLYYAKRRGYDLPAGQATPARLGAIRAEARGRFARVLVFSPDEKTRRLLTSLGGEPLASTRRVALFVLDRAPGEPSAARD
jgi:hypothetical protein